MEEKDLGKIVVVQDGVEKECDVLFTFNCEELGKKYFAFTDNSISSNGRKNIFIKAYNPLFGTEFENVTDPAELAMVQSVLRRIESE